MTLDLARQRIVVTGSAGFIGFHVTRALLEQDLEIFSFDAVNDYYSVELKRARLKALGGNKNHHFRQGRLENKADVETLFAEARPDIVVHLAAQAGVRYSMTHPQAYIDSNIQGFANILEECKKAGVRHLVYASSSSVYGGNAKLPFSESDAVEHPLSLYAATKKANELMAHSYSNIFGLPTTGLRFFTAYGPWGRPDMAMFLFAKAITEGNPIDVFNHGDMRRDFTYIDDIVSGVIAAMIHPPAANESWDAAKADPATSRAPWTVYNLGNNKPSNLMDVIGLIEKELGRKAKKNLLPLQPGDVPETCADISRAQRDLGFSPRTPVEEGLKEFISWYKSYFNC
ncbi:MAG TPA: NAD-dependent epimerase [Micavibrio sp.]|jgi:UDP-glucuronate 4-epimerase